LSFLAKYGAMRCINRRGENNTREIEFGRNKPLLNKKMGLFSRKSPIFGVWLPVVNELRTFGGVAEETTTGFGY
jgi:hypothetical protein